jgi:hypothetical protein
LFAAAAAAATGSCLPSRRHARRARTFSSTNGCSVPAFSAMKSSRADSSGPVIRARIASLCADLRATCSGIALPPLFAAAADGRAPPPDDPPMAGGGGGCFGFFFSLGTSAGYAPWT